MLTDDQVENLHHTSMRSFFHEQKERFEVPNDNFNSSEDIPDEEGELRWYDSQLSAMCAFNHFSKRFKALHLWDLAQEEHCLLISTKPKEDNDR